MLVFGGLTEDGVLAGKDQLGSMLGDAARQLSDALDAGTVPVASRSEARRLLLESWLAVQARSSAAIRRRQRFLLGRLVRLIEGGTVPTRPAPTVHRLAVSNDPKDPPLLSMVLRHEAVAEALASRTRRMVDKALAAAGDFGHAGVRPGVKGANEARRDDLELVVDDT
jgi:hypothetical protein